MKQKYSGLETKLKIWDHPRDVAMTAGKSDVLKLKSSPLIPRKEHGPLLPCSLLKAVCKLFEKLWVTGYNVGRNKPLSY